ncbi:Uncharacterised protein [Shigella sonnei]|nr:Uncharacterised protein [Shigella sonnei]
MASFVTFQAENIKHHTANVTADLHGWPFAPQHHASAECPQPAKELHRQYTPPANGTLIFQRPFNFRDPRTTCFRRVFAHQKVAKHRQHRRTEKSDG